MTPRRRLSPMSVRVSQKIRGNRKSEVTFELEVTGVVGRLQPRNRDATKSVAREPRDGRSVQIQAEIK